MPAAAVIPAPIAYIKVVAVKKLVVESVSRAVGSPPAALNWRDRETSCRWEGVGRASLAARGPPPVNESCRGALH